MKEKMISYSDHKRAMERSRYKATKKLAKVEMISKLETERKMTPKITWLRTIFDLVRSLDAHLRRKK